MDVSGLNDVINCPNFHLLHYSGTITVFGPISNLLIKFTLLGTDYEQKEASLRAVISNN